MAEQYITRIRTESGDLQIDYNSLGNLPGFETDITNLNNQVSNINKNISSLQGGKVSNTVTVNGKPLTDNITLEASDVGAANEAHEHKAADITSGVFPIERGGTNSSNGSTGLKNLLAAGAMILSSYQYGNSLPDSGTKGQIFFVKVQ